MLEWSEIGEFPSPPEVDRVISSKSSSKVQLVGGFPSLIEVNGFIYSEAWVMLAMDLGEFSSPLEVDRFISAGDDDTYRLIYEFPSPLEVDRFISV